MQNIGVVPDSSRRGRRKGSNRIHPALLVQAQSISIRRRNHASDLPELVSLIVPGQVLTRANTGTYLDISGGLFCLRVDAVTIWAALLFQNSCKTMSL